MVWLCAQAILLNIFTEREGTQGTLLILKLILEDSENTYVDESLSFSID